VGAVCIAGNYGTAKEKSLLAAWPLPRWPGWVEHVNGPQTEAELAALRRGVQRGSPFGKGAWCDQIVRRLGLESTLRPQGRPQKRENGS
jgi:putative transposase